jgi:hypothetical protein
VLASVRLVAQCRCAPVNFEVAINQERAEMAGTKEKDAAITLYCNFCGKSQHEVSHLVAGPNVYICAACTDLCGEIILGNDKKTLRGIRKLLGKSKAETDLSEVGVKPRFKKLRFRQKENHIFYLCPFSEPFNTIYSDHVKPTANSEGFSIDRTDEIYGTQPIIEDILEGINSAEIILADVTGRNPNVMYEIGMAHTVGKPVVILTQSIEDVPFDLKHHRCVVYSYTPRGCSLLQKKVAGTLTFIKGARG